MIHIAAATLRILPSFSQVRVCITFRHRVVFPIIPERRSCSALPVQMEEGREIYWDGRNVRGEQVDLSEFRDWEKVAAAEKAARKKEAVGSAARMAQVAAPQVEKAAPESEIVSTDVGQPALDVISELDSRLPAQEVRTHSHPHPCTVRGVAGCASWHACDFVWSQRHRFTRIRCHHARPAWGRAGLDVCPNVAGGCARTAKQARRYEAQGQGAGEEDGAASPAAGSAK